MALTSVFGCTSTALKEGTGEYIDDSVVTAKVKHAILHEPSLKSAKINVETFKRRAMESGALARSPR